MREFDVVVVGGGAAGIAAAIGARRAGASTLLVERESVLGGAATLRNVVTFCGLYTARGDQVVDGVASDVMRGLERRHAVTPPQRFTGIAVVFDPEELKVVLDRLVSDAGVEVELQSLVVGATSDGSTIESLEVATHLGIESVRASAFVDASGDAGLAVLAGADVRYGNDGLVQNGSLGVRFGGIPEDVVVGREHLREVLAGRVRDPEIRFGHGGLVARMPISGDLITYVVDAGYDARNSSAVTRATMGARQLAQEALEELRRLPGCDSAYIVSTGPELGTRESRHVIAREQLSSEALERPISRTDGVAIGAWPMEYHPGPGLPAEWRFVGDPGFYHIPLNSLRSANRDNLFAAGRVVDADRLAGSSLRVMGTAFSTGQAAGVAAALTARGHASEPTSVAAELRSQGVALPTITSSD